MRRLLNGVARKQTKRKERNLRSGGQKLLGKVNNIDIINIIDIERGGSSWKATTKTLSQQCFIKGDTTKPRGAETKDFLTAEQRNGIFLGFKSSQLLHGGHFLANPANHDVLVSLGLNAVSVVAADDFQASCAHAKVQNE